MRVVHASVTRSRTMPNLVGVPSSGNADRAATLDQGISSALSPFPLTGSRKAGTPAANGKTEQAADTPTVALVMKARRSPSSVESLGSLKMVKKGVVLAKIFFLQVPMFKLFVKRLMVASIEAPFEHLEKPVKTISVNAVEFS